MHLEPNDLMLFAQVADTGSFSRAAERLKLPKSTVSRRLSQLEAQLGERLLLRTTRKLSLTEFGLGVLEHARGVLHEVEAAQALAQHRQAEPGGRLRVSMPADLAHSLLAPMLAEFIHRHPAIRLELDLSPRRVDLIGESFDLALRMGALPDDASLAARRIALFSVSLYASPRYLDERGAPTEPEALMQHASLRILGRGGEAAPWLLSRGEQSWEGAPPSPVLVNSPELLMRLARLGTGIAAVADHFAEQWVARGELLPVLPDWSLPSETAWAVFPGRRLMPARTRAFLDAVQAQFDGPACKAAEDRVGRARSQAIARVRAVQAGMP